MCKCWAEHRPRLEKSVHTIRWSFHSLLLQPCIVTFGRHMVGLREGVFTHVYKCMCGKWQRASAERGGSKSMSLSSKITMHSRQWCVFTIARSMLGKMWSCLKGGDTHTHNELNAPWGSLFLVVSVFHCVSVRLWDSPRARAAHCKSSWVTLLHVKSWSHSMLHVPN